MNFMENHHNAGTVQDNAIHHSSLQNGEILGRCSANSFEDYAALALKRARDQTRTGRDPIELASRRNTYPLFDTARFTRNFEAALMRMHARRQNGEAPADFAVA